MEHTVYETKYVPVLRWQCRKPPIELGPTGQLFNHWPSYMT